MILRGGDEQREMGVAEVVEPVRAQSHLVWGLAAPALTRPRNPPSPGPCRCSREGVVSRLATREYLWRNPGAATKPGTRF